MPKGFTLIEMMIAGVIISIIAILLLGSKDVANGNASFGVNGFVETRCINGYTFVVGHRSQPTQVMDEKGHGVKCQ